MRNLFPGFYDPTDEDTSKLWQDGIFVFDTNMLLHMYRYSPEARDRFFETLSLLKDRIWIPFQVAYEYQDRRLTVISEQIQAYDTAIKLLDATLTSLKAGLEQFKTRHAFIDPVALTEDITKAFANTKSKIQKAKHAHPDYKKKDPLRKKIDELFDGKVGEAFTKEKLEEKYKEAEIRFQRLIPPGLEDADKKGARKYGDVIIWFQLIDFAYSKKKPIIFVTDDEKKDWWLTGEVTKGPLKPRPELVQEIFTETHVPFHMYQGYVFMEKAQEFLRLDEKPEVIQEIKDVSEEAVAETELLQEEKRRKVQTVESLPLASYAHIDPSVLQGINEIANSPALRLLNEVASSYVVRAARDIARIYNNLYFPQTGYPLSGVYNTNASDETEAENNNPNDTDEENREDNMMEEIENHMKESGKKEDEE